MAKEKVKRKINKKALIVILLTLYLCIMAFYYYFTLPIKNIVIKGNTLSSDQEIIKEAGIKDYPKMFSISSRKVANNVKNISTIKDVKVKKNILGKITIEVKEANVIFYNVLNKAYVLADGQEKEFTENSLGVSTLVNYVPDDIYKQLINKMKDVDLDILSLISEIEYNPDIKNDITIDEFRFLLRMNDGNIIYINLANFENINRYKKMYTVLGDTKGYLMLDSIIVDANRFPFTPFNAEDIKNEGGSSNELPEGTPEDN